MKEGKRRGEREREERNGGGKGQRGRGREVGRACAPIILLADDVLHA